MKSLSRGFKLYLCSVILIVIVLSILSGASWFYTISSVFGIIYVLLVAKNLHVSFLFGIVHVITYGIILNSQGLYGGVIYNILYSLPMLIYGFFKWKKVKDNDNFGIQLVNKSYYPLIVIGCIISVLVYSWTLMSIHSSNYFLDASISILSYLNVYFVVNKYYEQWYVCNLLNSLGIVLWSILTIKDISNIPILLLWIIYLVNSIYGGIYWKSKLMDLKKS